MSWLVSRCLVGQADKLASLKVVGKNRSLKAKLRMEEAEHPLSMLQTRAPDKINVRRGVRFHGWGLNLLLLLTLGASIGLFYAGVTQAAWIVFAVSFVPLLLVQIYDHLPALFSWEQDEKDKQAKKKKPAKDRSGVEPYRSKLVGRTLKIVSVIALALMWYQGWMIFAPLALVPLYFGNLLATVPPTLVRKSDKRAPILYLRSFLDDRKSTLTPESGAATFMGVVPPAYLPSPWRYLLHFHPVRVLRILFGRSVDTSEEQLAMFFRQYGPFVAIGKPGENFASPGASRMYVTNEEWQNVVLEHLATSQVVLLQPAKTEGIWWEVEQTIGKVDPRRVLLCMVNFHRRQNDYEKFRIRAEAFTGQGLPRYLGYTDTACFIYFDADWKPYVQQVSCRAPITWPIVGDPVDLRYTLQPFLNSVDAVNQQETDAKTNERGDAADETQVAEVAWVSNGRDPVAGAHRNDAATRADGNWSNVSDTGGTGLFRTHHFRFSPDLGWAGATTST